MISDSTQKPLACWPGTELYNGEVIPCLTVIFHTTGCTWNRCRMCGYKFERTRITDRGDKIRALLSQLAWLEAHHPLESFRMVKIFTSGSFFDEEEVPHEAREAIAEAFQGKIVVAESRTEFIHSDIIAPFKEQIDDASGTSALYVAMGLETTNDFIREKCIDKGHTFADFIEAVKNARQAGAGVKTYLMLKPLFLTEREALEDMKRSIAEAGPYSDIISMNLCTVQRRTEVERYWKQGAYRPPYLWSAVDILLSADYFVQSDPVGGGKIRGPHNCGTCDREFVHGISEYSLSGDREILRNLMEQSCACKKEWEHVLEHEEPWCMPLTR